MWYLWLLLINEPVIDRFQFMINIKPNKNWFESIFKTITMMIDYDKHIWNDKVTNKSNNLKIQNYEFRHDHSLKSYFKAVSVLVLAIITNTTSSFIIKLTNKIDHATNSYQTYEHMYITKYINFSPSWHFAVSLSYV